MKMWRKLQVDNKHEQEHEHVRSYGSSLQTPSTKYNLPQRHHYRLGVHKLSEYVSSCYPNKHNFTYPHNNNGFHFANNIAYY